MKITEEWPFSYVVNDSYESSCCHFCLKTGRNLRRCSGCHFAHYCDQKCQTSGWRDHRPECKRLKAVLPRVPPASIRHIARTIFRMKEVEKSKVEKPGDRQLEDLMSHTKEMAADPIRNENFKNTYDILKVYLSDKESILNDEEALREICGKVVVNSLGILDADLNPVGLGLYLNLSEMDHSCDPDCNVAFLGPKAILNLIKPNVKPEKALKKLTISYTELFTTTLERQHMLQSRFYFTCQCNVCLDIEQDMEKTGLKCTDPLCDGICVILSDDQTLCQKCKQAENDVQKIQQAHTAMDLIKSELEDIDLEIKFDQHESVLKKCKRILLQCDQSGLHSFNYYRLMLLNRMFDCAVNVNQIEMAESFIKQTVPAYVKFCKPYHPRLGSQLCKWGIVLCHLGKTEEAINALKRAETILEICYGGTENDQLETSKSLLFQCLKRKVAYRIDKK